MKHFILIIFALFISTQIASQTLVGVANEWPPFTDKTIKGEGLAIEIVRAAYETQGYDIEIQYFPWARALNGVKEADHDFIVAIWRTEEREAFLSFSDPYLENKITFIKQKGNDFEFEGIQSLAGKSVGVIRGYGYGDKFLNDKNFRRPATNDLMQNMKKLAAGRIDLTLEDEVVARYELKNKAPELLEQVEFTQNALSLNKLHLGTSLAHSKRKQIIESFNKGLAQIKNNGTYDAILGSYGF